MSKHLDDPLAWIQRQKAKSQKIAKSTHTKSTPSTNANNDHIDIQVSHDLNDFQAGKDHILVLKDSEILKDEDDVLIDASIPTKVHK